MVTHEEFVRIAQQGQAWAILLKRQEEQVTKELRGQIFIIPAGKYRGYRGVCRYVSFSLSQMCWTLMLQPIHRKREELIDTRHGDARTFWSIDTLARLDEVWEGRL